MKKGLLLKSVLLLSCASLVFTFSVGCGKKKKEIAQETQNQEDLLAEKKSTLEAGQNSSDQKTMEQMEEYTGSKVKSSSGVFSGQFSENGRYVVQISASRFEESSNKLAEKLKNEGTPAYVTTVENPTSDLTGTYYRVRIGAFNTVTEAKNYGETIVTQMGHQFWVDNKSNDNVAVESSEDVGNGSSSSSSSSYGSASSTGTTGSTTSGTSSSSSSSSSSFWADTPTSSTPAPVTPPPTITEPPVTQSSSSYPPTSSSTTPSTTNSGTTSGSEWGSSSTPSGSSNGSTGSTGSTESTGSTGSTGTPATTDW